jgi:multiple antibiotic resistance protein
MLEFFVDTLVILFIVVDPLGVAPTYVALTQGESPGERRRIALRGVIIAAVVLILFLAGGDYLLSLLGISLPAFQIAGGLLLFLLAVDMVFARHSGLRSTTEREQREAEHRRDISVFPLAIPLIAGPGAITTVLLMSGAQANDAVALTITLIALLAVLGLTLCTLLFAGRILGTMGETGANVISRVLGIILAALAVQYVVDGFQSAFAPEEDQIVQSIML